VAKVQEALRRLEEAVSRLELAARGAVNGDAERLAASRADFGSLAHTTEAVAERLDAVIGRLDRVLEG
jgi:hypothetical protein